MLARVVRSNVTESTHDGVVAVVDPDGAIIATAGATSVEFFARSSIKPLQAAVSMEHGAALTPEWLALACASHDGDPVHLSIVEAMLDDAGLDTSDLGCPPSRPYGSAWLGDRTSALFHNCSGKHAAFLRACVASGWDSSSYLEPSHPLQQRVADFVSETTGTVPTVGIDGCGAPTFTVTAPVLAKAFARLGNDSRLDGVFRAMHAYPRLVSGVGNPDADSAVALHAASKRGAEGCLGMVVRGRGALAVKVFDGSSRSIGPVVWSVLDQLGWLTPSMAERLAVHMRRPMFGGGREVGSVESVVQLSSP